MDREIQAHEVQYQTLPAKYREEMRAYIERGVRPGPFIQRVLDGDLYGAYQLSGPLPETPSNDLTTVTGWVFGQCPIKAFGTIGAVESWIALRGLQGADIKRRQQERDAQDYRDRMLDAGGADNVRAFMGVIQGVFGRKS